MLVDVPWQEVLDLAEESHQLFQRAHKSNEELEENSTKALVRRGFVLI
jgi:hypothetical protein